MIRQLNGYIVCDDYITANGFKINNLDNSNYMILGGGGASPLSSVGSDYLLLSGGGTVNGNLTLVTTPQNYSEGVRIANSPQSYSTIVLGCSRNTKNSIQAGAWAINKNADTTFTIKPCVSNNSLIEGLKLTQTGDAYWKGSSFKYIYSETSMDIITQTADLLSFFNTASYSYCFHTGPVTHTIRTTSYISSMTIGQIYKIIINPVCDHDLDIDDTLTNNNLSLIVGEIYTIEFVRINSSRVILWNYK